MQSSIRNQIERLVLRSLYPQATSGKIKRLHDLCKQKGIGIIAIPQHVEAVEYVMISIIRHESTQYESALRSGCSKESARGIIAPIIRSEMKKMKGEI